jgi:hypothetical protein
VTAGPVTRCKCGKRISRTTAHLNGGLCDACLERTLRKIARDLGKKKGSPDL